MSLQWSPDWRVINRLNEEIRKEQDYEDLWFKEFAAKNREVAAAAKADGLDKRRASVAAGACTEKDTGRFPHVCRRCAWCLRQRQRQWVHRARHEYYSHERTWFVTLTYRGDTEKSYKEVQKWLKRVRGKSPLPLRFMATEERGEKRSRKHWHVLLHCSANVSKRALKHQWKHGRCQLNLVKKASGAAAYASKYLCKDDAPSRIRASVAYGNGLRAIQRARPDLCAEYDDWLFDRGLRPSWVRCWGRISQHAIERWWVASEYLPCPF